MVGNTGAILSSSDSGTTWDSLSIMNGLALYGLVAY